MRDKRFLNRSDVIFTVAVVVVALLLWVAFSFRPAGNTVVFRQNGQVLAELPLSEDAKYEIHGAYTNVFEIKNGGVRVVFTDCPNHQCERSGAVFSAGASIACAPNGVSAEITGKGGVDAVTG